MAIVGKRKAEHDSERRDIIRGSLRQNDAKTSQTLSQRKTKMKRYLLISIQRVVVSREQSNGKQIKQKILVMDDLLGDMSDPSTFPDRLDP